MEEKYIDRNVVASQLNQRSTFNAAYTFIMVVGLVTIMYSTDRPLFFYGAALILILVNLLYLYTQIRYKIDLLKRYTVQIQPFDSLLYHLFVKKK